MDLLPRRLHKRTALHVLTATELDERNDRERPRDRAERSGSHTTSAELLEIRHH
jgi:hypothetical protein